MKKQLLRIFRIGLLLLSVYSTYVITKSVVEKKHRLELEDRKNAVLLQMIEKKARGIDSDMAIQYVLQKKESYSK